MRILRSREVTTSSVPPIRLIKHRSPPKTLESNGVLMMEPLTPAKSAEEPTKLASHTPDPSPAHTALSPVILRSELGSESVVLSGDIVIRRSSRLASKSSSGEFGGSVVFSSRKRRMMSGDNGSNCSNELGLGNVGSLREDMELEVEKSVSNLGKMGSVMRVHGNGLLSVDVSGSGDDDGEKSCVNLRSGKRISKVVVTRNAGDGFAVTESGQGDKFVHEDERKGKEGAGVAVLKTTCVLGSVDMKERGNVTKEEEYCASDGVRRRSSRVKKEKGKGNAVENRGVMLELKPEVNAQKLIGITVSGDCLSEEMEIDGTDGRSKSTLNRDAKGKGKVVEDDLPLNHAVIALDLEQKVEKSNGCKVSGDILLEEIGNARRGEETSAGGRRKTKFTREEKGKKKASDIDLSLNHAVLSDSDLELGKSNANKVSGATCPLVDSAGQDGMHVSDNSARAYTTRYSHMDRFRDIARKNASRFAHFSHQEEEENHVIDEAEEEVLLREMNQEIEDWPGPFSTAMKIIKDRETNANSQQNSRLETSDPTPVEWLPRKDQHKSLKLVAPSLQELCMGFLAKNADAITSLDNVPDLLRHKLSQLLCDARRMNAHFVDLLVRGSPTEIRIKDCSWLSEELFTKTFEGTDTTKLTVLQLDQCGRCLPDYTLFATLVPSSNHLPALTTISVKGACRLSDSGLSVLVSSAPTLKSINLSQCSLLTADAINSLAATLGSVLKELYLDDCESIDPMLILPALSKLEHLEVLSLAGIQSVSDDFISQFVPVCGENLKEFSLANCTKLTDFSMRAIAETCSKLCNIDLTNLRKLTDSGIGYLANGCQGIQTLKLCRNTFSDEAVAAYLETCGESLKELSLNNVKVAHNTALSLSKRSRNLLSLDLSWCRNLTNEALGLIVDSCLSLKVLKLFGCTQITNVFIDGHSNPQVQVIGLKFSPILKHIEVPELLGQLHYSSA